jgi:hypothetical protein
MEDLRQYLTIVAHTYRLDAVDATLVAGAVTSVCNWMFPVFFGTWIAKKIVPIAHPDLPWKWRTFVRFLPAVATPLVGGAVCYLHLRKHQFKALLEKYPQGTNFEARPKVNPFRSKKA